MTNRKIKWVITSAVIALAGVLFLQGFWIYKSWNTYLYNYNHRVRQAAYHAAHRIEKGQVKEFLREEKHRHHHRKGRHNQIRMIKDSSSEVIVDLSLEDDGNMTKIVVINGDTTKKVIVEGDNGGTQSNRVAIWNSHVEDIELEEYISDSSIKSILNNIVVDSIIQSELEKENLSKAYTYRIYSKGDNEFREYHKSRRMGKAVVPLFRRTLGDQPLFLQVQLEEHKAKLPLWLLAMIGLSIVFSSVIIWAFWFAITGMINQKKVAELKTDFINNMTHEFKTPISTISLAADSLKLDQVKSKPDQVEHYSEVIQEENKRMNRQVEQILQAAQYEKGELQFRYEAIDVVELCRSVVDSFQLLLKERNGRLEIVNSENEIVIQGDKTHLFNMLANLVDNAIKFTEHDPKIELRIQRADGHLLIAVKDNGIGISKEDQKQLFAPFFRAKQGDLHTYKGFGLGLNYVKQVVEYLNGKIEVSSATGVGSKFTINLPLHGK